jgi:hypothetical protein
MTWVFYMLRLIDIADTLDVEGAITSNKIITKILEMEGIYDTFGLYEEPEHNPYIAVGVEKRECDDNHLDAYILVGLRVRVDAEVQVGLTDEMKDELDYWLCKENVSLALDANNFHVVQNDAAQVQWLVSIVLDMEDGSRHGDIAAIIGG